MSDMLPKDQNDNTSAECVKWKTVPVEPFENMLRAMTDANESDVDWADSRRAYKAALEASPEPPESESFAELISVNSILRHRINQMLKAIDAGGIDSDEIDLGDGSQPHRWHEEWSHGTRDILKKMEANNETDSEDTVTTGSSNIFRDLGCDNPDEMLAESASRITRDRCIRILVKRAKQYHRNTRKSQSIIQQRHQYSMYMALMMAAREIKKSLPNQPSEGE